MKMIGAGINIEASFAYVLFGIRLDDILHS